MRVVSACLLALLGCGTDPDSFSRCDSNISVTVSHEPAPQFSWTPADCQMYEIGVDEDRQPQWLMNSNDNVNRISSPVRYGADLFGNSGSQATPLHTGFFYRVDLWRINEDGQLRRVVSQRFLHEVE